MPGPTRASPPAGPAPVAEWDFGRHDPMATLDSAHRLADGPNSRAQVVPTALGAAVRLDGCRDHLLIPSDRLGDLDVGRSGDCVSVFALVRRRGSGTGFIAGMWQEDDGDPQRQYGLFIDLPTYGGADQVAGHVSADGAASPRLPYSRDYSATARRVPRDQWRVVGFTYDGRHARSYLDGLPDERDAYTEPGAPVGEGLTYGKNPYYYPSGLKRSSTSPFTVGAVTLTSGLGNFFHGDIARLAVWDSTLSNREALCLAVDWTTPGAPLARFDFSVARETDEPEGAPASRQPRSLGSAGWKQERIIGPRIPKAHSGANLAVDSSPADTYLCRDGAPAARGLDVAVFPLDGSLQLGDIGEASYRDLSFGASETTAVAVKIGERWLTSAAVSRDLLAHGERITTIFDDSAWSDVVTGAPTTPGGSTALQAIGLVAHGDHQTGLRVTDLQLYPPTTQEHRAAAVRRPSQRMDQPRTGSPSQTWQDNGVSA